MPREWREGRKVGIKETQNEKIRTEEGDLVHI
jgi:hypothetical protein